MSFLGIYQLQKDLTGLSSNPETRRLLSSVVQNPQNETIDLRASAASVMENGLGLETKQSLREIRAFLQNLYFFHAFVDGRKENASIFNAFLYENHTRLQKLLVVAKLLDHANLQSFGTPESPVFPMPSDIPTYAHLWGVIQNFQSERLEGIHKRNKKMLASMDPNFLLLCPEDDRKAFEERSMSLRGSNEQ